MFPATGMCEESGWPTETRGVSDNVSTKRLNPWERKKEWFLEDACTLKIQQKIR